MRERLEDEPAFTAVTVESERIRLFNDHISTLEVSINFLLGFRVADIRWPNLETYDIIVPKEISILNR